jgi:hypothetical protein
MRSVMRSLVAGCAMLSLAAVPATAQTVRNFGFVAGVDFSTFVGSDADLGSLGLDKGSLTGFLGGVFVDVPLGASVMLEPSAMYIGKGAKYSISETGFTGDVTFDVEYIEIPVLIRYNFKADGGPYALIGPAVAFNVSCSVSGSGDADLPKTDCVQIGTLAGVPFDATSVTFGGIVGLGFQHQRIGLEGRYEFDFSDAFKDAGSVKNAAWEILLRYSFK